MVISLIRIDVAQFSLLSSRGLRLGIVRLRLGLMVVLGPEEGGGFSVLRMRCRISGLRRGAWNRQAARSQDGEVGREREERGCEGKQRPGASVRGFCSWLRE